MLWRTVLMSLRGGDGTSAQGSLERLCDRRVPRVRGGAGKEERDADEAALVYQTPRGKRSVAAARGGDRDQNW
ncbi:hypothetical protein BBB56_03095 [Candidatus Pantoea deserta]|uniref:Uncharacterized protein n=1 Tax=Candidatus Pantoea deserta TaxID=1869313 RepID=A0A3N4PVH3_9GAMM|nr:hypothetical protein BBB56_03095 [Pantoea deserta]